MIGIPILYSKKTYGLTTLVLTSILFCLYDLVSGLSENEPTAPAEQAHTSHHTAAAFSHSSLPPCRQGRRAHSIHWAYCRSPPSLSLVPRQTEHAHSQKRCRLLPGHARCPASRVRVWFPAGPQVLVQSKVKCVATRSKKTVLCTLLKRSTVRPAATSSICTM